ncbi:hypothetical protein ACJX0J_032135 [Zea mays]
MIWILFFSGEIEASGLGKEFLEEASLEINAERERERVGSFNYLFVRLKLMMKFPSLAFNVIIVPLKCFACHFIKYSNMESNLKTIFYNCLQILHANMLSHLRDHFLFLYLSFS